MALSSLLPEDFERQLHCTTGAYTLNTSNFLFWIWRFNPLPPKHLHISYITCNVTAQSFFFFFFYPFRRWNTGRSLKKGEIFFWCFHKLLFPSFPPPPPNKKKHTFNRLNIYFFFHLWPSQCFIHMLAFGRFSTIFTQALLQLNKPSVSHDAWPSWCPRPVLWELASFLA